MIELNSTETTAELQAFMHWANEHLPAGWDEGIGPMRIYDAIGVVASRAGFRQIEPSEKIRETLAEFREWWMSK